jgi:hypothetical protein
MNTTPAPLGIKLSIPRTEKDLTAKTMVDLRETFKQRTHNLSDVMMLGLEQIPLAIQGMENGDPLPAKTLVTTLAPGVGKTTVTAKALKHLRPETGAIVFVPRVELIPVYVAETGAQENEYATYVSKKNYPEVHAMGLQGKVGRAKARLLFTTHQRLEQYLSSGRKFSELHEFHYRSFPRTVLIRDEGAQPAISLTLRRAELRDMVTPLERAGYHEAASTIEDFATELRYKKAGDQVIVPDLRHYQIPDDTFDIDQAKAWLTLTELSALPCRVQRDDFSNTVLNYKEAYPEDMPAMVVLDASGEHNPLYGMWKADRGSLEFLYSPPKDYSGLTRFHWNHAAGNRTFNRFQTGRHQGNPKPELLEIVREVAALLKTRPEGIKVLVVYRLPRTKHVVDFKEELLKAMRDDDVSGISFTTWGLHTGTNEFKDHQWEIQVGAFVNPTSANEAHARGAKKLTIEQELEKADLERTRVGIAMHNCFQAAGRIAIRKSEGDTCPKGLKLFTVFWTRRPKGIPEESLDKLFPGSRATRELASLERRRALGRERFRRWKARGRAANAGAYKVTPLISESVSA